VSYDSRPYLGTCLDALCRQSFRDFEVRVVENSVGAPTRSLLPDDPRFSFVASDRNLGFAEGANHALRGASATWLASLNPDVTPETNWLAELMAAAERFPFADLFGSTQLDASDPGRCDGCGDAYFALGLPWRGGSGRPASEIASDGEPFSVCAAAALISNRAYRRVGGFDGSYFCYYEDVDLAFRVRLQGGRCVQVHRAVVHHVGSAQTGVDSAFTLYHSTRNRWSTFARDMPGPLLVPLVPGFLLLEGMLLFRAARRGQLIASLRGLRDGVRGLPRQLQVRKALQAQRTVSALSLARALTWSPGKLLRHQSDLRPLPEQGTTQSPLAERAAPSLEPPPRGAVAVSVGIVNYRSYEELGSCLESVFRSSLAPDRVCVYDADGREDARAQLSERFPAVTWEVGPNLGYAGGANALLADAPTSSDREQFFLLLNPDVVIERCFVQQLVSAMFERPDVALAGGKLLRPEGGRIDSAGIVLPRHRRPRDRGSEHVDLGHFDRLERIFGATGAAMMLRVRALADLSIEGEVFDEDFFLYHEDTDLSWRANLLGWSVLYVPSARARHGRRWRRERRFGVPNEVRRHSFKNHYLQLVKNQGALGGLAILPNLVVWEVMRLGFALLRDRAMLGAYRQAFVLLPRAWRKRRQLQRRVRARRRALRSGTGLPWGVALASPGESSPRTRLPSKRRAERRARD
jgi:GT2 family glycosyltransferase